MADHQTPVSSTLPLLKRSLYFLQLWGFKLLIRIQVSITSFLESQPSSQRPTRTKIYSCRPRLENRIFIPRNHKSGELLPLYIDIHGGGFAFCAPSYDDEFCSAFCNSLNIIVVSADYSKTPSVAFPVPTHDIAAIAQAVINDDTLPIDKSRVAIGGFSAGGNLAVSASQLPELRGKIRAIVPFYPPMDFATPLEQKQATMLFKNPGEKDPLIGLSKIFNYGYIRPGQDLMDPLLSTYLARKEDLPEFVFGIAAEYDMLANEARVFMCKLGGIEEPTEEEKYEFERGTYKWKLVRDVTHGFTHKQYSRGEAQRKRVKILDEIIEEVGEWLFKGPFS